MNAIRNKLTNPLNDDDLNELVLEAAADVTRVEIDTDITLLNKPAQMTDHAAEQTPAKNEDTIAEQLVNAGNDEALIEQRLAAATSLQKKL
jgi:hypothetical protein